MEGGGIKGIPMSVNPRPASIMLLNEGQDAYSDLGWWTFAGWNDFGGEPGTAVVTTYAGKSNFAFWDSHVSSYSPCQTYGSMTGWNGNAPADDFMWAWWDETRAFPEPYWGPGYWYFPGNAYSDILSAKQACVSSYVNLP